MLTDPLDRAAVAAAFPAFSADVDPPKAPRRVCLALAGSRTKCSTSYQRSWMLLQSSRHRVDLRDIRPRDIVFDNTDEPVSLDLGISCLR